LRPSIRGFHEYCAVGEQEISLIVPEHITKEQSAYLGRFMKGVSRSFAVVAPEVDTPLEDYLAAAYLICRVVDNIEDVEQPFAWRQKRFAEFKQLLQSPHSAESLLTGWEQLAWPGLSGVETEMMTCEGGLMLWQIYAQMPQSYREPIRHWADVMAFGMERSGNPQGRNFFVNYDGVRLPKREADYDMYCFYVAGTVGRMITAMAVEFYDVDDDSAQHLFAGSDACGRALQKTNIVKDFAGDLERGFCFLPGEWLAEIEFRPLALDGAPDEWKKKVLLNVVQELDASVSYVLSLPRPAVGFKKAGLLMMLPAYETILLAAERLQELFTPYHSVKISRTKMGQCILRARRMATDDAAIAAFSQEMSHQIHLQLDKVPSHAE
jgi:phytoene/squalene synthetase